MKPTQGRGQLPDGVRDVLYGEAASRRRLEGTLLETYGRWGYHEVATPTLELLDNMLPGLNGQAQDELYKLMDRRGRILALRPDMTTPIARLVGTHLQQVQPPLRLCYSAPVFRYTAGNTARPHEVRQSGVELLGEPGAEGDAEVIALAAEALRAAGVTTFALSLSHSRILEGILRQCGVTAEAAADLRQALLERDLVRYGQAVQGLGLPAEDERLLMLATALGNLDQVGRELAERLRDGAAQQALAEVRQVVTRLEDLGVMVPVHLDLGLVRGLDYYTGLVFEAYVPGSGLPVGGGGRYDQLLGYFGRDLEATGFALDVDLLLAARERQLGTAERTAGTPMSELAAGGPVGAGAGRTGVGRAGRPRGGVIPFPSLQGGIH